MTRQRRMSKADKAVHAIIEDIRGRRGLCSEWGQIDLDVRNEIQAKWATLIAAAMGGKEPGAGVVAREGSELEFEPEAGPHVEDVPCCRQAP